MEVKITVMTPRNQAAKSIKTMKDSLLGFNKAGKVKREKLLADNKFYWIIDCEDQKELDGIIKKAARGEILIKKFYSVLFKLLGRANKLAEKTNKGMQWLKRWLIKRLKKTYQDQSDNGMTTQIENMKDEELKEFIKINDKESMQKLLSGTLIDVEVLK